MVSNSTPFCIKSAPILAETVDVIVKLNVIVPVGDPVELNVNAFDVGVKDGVLSNPLILVTVAVAEAHCWLNVKLNEISGGIGALPYLPTVVLELIFVFDLIVILILYYLNPPE
jgi:hypothetical protein